MIALESLRWVLTIAFVATSAFHLARCLWHAAGDAMVSEALHMVMGVSMVAMIWPWGDVVPAPVWVAVFTVSTGWFVARALGSAGRRLVPAFFATSMAAMVWMGASMPAQASAGRHEMTMDMPAGSLGLAGWISGVLGGYLVLAAFWWFFRGLRLGGLRLSSLAAGDLAAGDLAAGDLAAGDLAAGEVAVGGVQPLSWSSLCHGLMSIGMGLALLAMA
jgi:hypothetical protein